MANIQDISIRSYLSKLVPDNSVFSLYEQKIYTNTISQNIGYFHYDDNQSLTSHIYRGYYKIKPYENIWISDETGEYIQLHDIISNRPDLDEYASIISYDDDFVYVAIWVKNDSITNGVVFKNVDYVLGVPF